MLRIWTAVSLLLVSVVVHAQNVGNSPYSRLGLGDLRPSGYVRQAGMGMAGSSAPHPEFINTLNPALLSFNPYQATVIEVGLSGQYKEIASGDNSDTQQGGSISYLSALFPLSKRSGLQVAYTPYSTVNYDVTSAGVVQGIEGTELFEDRRRGQGGLNRAQLGYSYRPDSGMFSFGLQASYLFGNISNEVDIRLLSDIAAGRPYTAYQTLTEYDGLSLKPGVALRRQISKKVVANLAASAEYFPVLRARRSQSLSRRNPLLADNAPDFPIPGIDTTVSEAGEQGLPPRYTLGVSFDRLYRWTVALDVAYQGWNSFELFDESQLLQNSYTVALGGEWTPEVNAVEGYFRRVTYRAGVRYQNTPYRTQETAVEDIGITFGMTLPISNNVGVTRFSNFSLAVQLGQRGTLDDGLLRERYARFTLGFSLGERWFNQYRVD